MANLPQGTIVAKKTCPSCGTPVQVKLNKNGIAYYYCSGQTADFEQCSHHEKWGRADSQKMQRAFLEARKSHQPEPEPQAAPEPDPEQVSEVPPVAAPVKEGGAHVGCFEFG